MQLCYAAVGDSAGTASSACLAAARWVAPLAHGVCRLKRALECLPPSPLPCPTARLVLVAPDEWAKGAVRVKDLASREEADVPLDQLV